MTSRWSIFVPGIPQSRGSKNAIPFRRGNGSLGVAVKDDNPKSKAWMSLASLAAEKAMDGYLDVDMLAQLAYSADMDTREQRFEPRSAAEQDAMQAGEQAGRTSPNTIGCPHDGRTRLGVAWWAGFLEGDRQRCAEAQP